MQLRNLRHLLHQRTKELKTISDQIQNNFSFRQQIKLKLRLRKRIKIQRTVDYRYIIEISKFGIKQYDINDLDLEEKKKLLRILFSKMNQGVPPINWKSQLGHVHIKIKIN
ncbi:unnamed protein product [Paramecium sonneborni]|uniref:Uncharacterized protein n=1 Tax=Paramecium sonneborni TaxID=65129 RepID=A0A8S1L5Z8_9CILI|nr:unnamed protein product [Paramecium sonneborni]